MEDTETAETTAAIDFVDWFKTTYSCGSTVSHYNFKITNLQAEISRIRKHPKDLLIFYLHTSKSEFSKNFCCFLQNPEIQGVFRKGRFHLYCWNIDNKLLKPKLTCAVNLCLGEKYSSYIEKQLSVLLTIKAENNVPFVHNTFCDAADLLKLHSLLTDEEVAQEVEEKISPLSFQKSIAERLGDRDYDCIEHDEHELLKMKIGFALYGVPMDKEGTAYNKKQQQHIDKLFAQILKQNNKFCKWNGKIVISFVYVCTEPLPSEKDKKAQYCGKRSIEYNRDADFEPHPIFVLRKCKHPDPYKACRIVIDDDGRVYYSWWDYLHYNKLPPCKMTYPKGGRYTPSPGDNCTTYMTKLSPSCNLSTKVIKIMDKAFSIGGLIASGITIFSTAPIISLPAAAAGITSGIYASVRSIQALVDRGTHKEGVNPFSSENRTTYLNIAGGILNAALFGSLEAPSLGANRGMIFGQGTKYILYGINGATLGVGSSVVNDERKPSPILLAQLVASALFFSNALYTFGSIRSITKDNTQLLEEIKNDLRGSKPRCALHKLLHKIIRSSSKEKLVIIAPIRSINDVNSLIVTLKRDSTLLNQRIKYSVKNGDIYLNGSPVKMNDLGMISKTDRGAFLKRIPPLPKNFTPNIKNAITRAVNGFFADTAMRTILNVHADETINDMVEEVFCAFEQHATEFILNVTKGFLTNLDSSLIDRLKTIFNSECFGSVIVRWIVNAMKDTSTFKKVTEGKKPTSQEVAQVIVDLNDNFRCWFTRFNYDRAKREERKENRRKANTIKKRKSCRICGGYYYS